MRKILLMMITVIIPFLLSGCGTSVGTGVFFGPGGVYPGADVFFYNISDKKSLSSQDIILLNDMKTDFKNNGYIVDDLNTPNKIGFKAFKHIDDIEKNDISGIPDMVYKVKPKLLTINRVGSKKYCKLRTIVDLSDINNLCVTRIERPINFKLSIPSKVKYTNASKISDGGKSLEWQLNSGKKNLIEADFEI